MWTALPRAASGDELEIDVLVSPRLGLNAAPGTEFTLGEFPELAHWTATLRDHLTFEVELADGSRNDATVVAPASWDTATWDHLFRASTFVRPWTFRDLSTLPIYSYSVRFVMAYLRDVYSDLGRRYPTLPPPRDKLDPLRETVAPVVDVRVAEERAAPPREPQDIPIVHPPEPAPPAEAKGCAAWLWRLLERLCRLLRPLCRRLPKRLRWELGVIARLLKAALAPDGPPPPDPTKPKVAFERTIHPSAYVAKPPISPASLPVLEQLEQQMAADKAIAPAAPQGSMSAALAARNMTFDFARAKRFFERPESENPPADAPPPAKPRLDFHQALGALGDYPELMRRLGLVVRLKIDRPAADPGSVRVITLWDGVTRSTDVGPRTACKLDGDRFTAAHKPGSEAHEGMLDLRGAGDRLATDAPQFDVVQADSDGAAMKIILTAATLERVHQLETLKVTALDRRERETTPALRSGGLAIVRADRAWHVHQHLTAAAVQKTPTAAAGAPAELPSELFAEDLVRGYRIAVSTAGGPWQSLCARVGVYDLVDDAGTVVRQALTANDEGYVKRTSATSSAGVNNPLYVHEVLARWTGWSLVAQRPGLTLENHVDGPPPPGEKYDRPALPRNDAETEFRLVTRFTPQQGTLPRLRFGLSYRLRAVCVDLSGEPLGEPLADAAHSDAVTYRRFEPAGPAALLALRAFLPGESLERLVVRSDHDRDSAAYDAAEMGLGTADAAAQRTRHAFPPKTSQQMAEQHGMLDAAFGTNGVPGDPTAGYKISLRESGTFSNPKVAPFGDPQRVDDLWINRADATLPTPYLADPIVAGAALRGVPGLVDHVTGDPLAVFEVRAGDPPGGSEPLLQVPYERKWPDVAAFRLRVAERTAPAAQPPHWDAAARLLTVFLAKAERAQVRYSSYVLPDSLDAHGLWDWLDDEDPAAVLRNEAARGAHWMISPARTLDLVHAVQHPVAPARFTALEANRSQLGQTTAELANGVLELHAASTGRVDTIGRWTEFLDDPVDGVREEPRMSVACDHAVGTDWSSGMTFPPPDPAVRSSHEFGDTRHRMVRYLVRATSSFREYLREDITPAELTRDTPAADEVEISVLNSARPIVPSVLYAVPTFEWASPAPAAGWLAHTQVRGGGGLRVYLDRPWFTSGEGELLGLVLQRPGGPELPDSLRSRYGLDAIWRGGNARQARNRSASEARNLEPKHFANVVKASDVSLAEPGGLTAVVVGFRPQWDTERKFWFCDIELEVEALPWNYWPFVRMAFVRFQPESLPDAMISKVALGEFGQVAPERTLSLAWQSDQVVRATLRGRAPLKPFPPHVAFRVQTTSVPSGSDPDELDWDFAAGHPVDVTWSNFSTLVAPDDPDGDGNVSWEMDVALPTVRGSQRMRLEVAEYELLSSDSEFGRGLTRVTYAAHVALD